MPPPYTVLVLAGGRGRRMGQPKHQLRVDGETLLDRAVRRLSPGAQEVLVAAPESLAVQPGEARRVFDRREEGGPLAGIEAGLRAAHTDWVVVVGVDLPLVDADLARRLATAGQGFDAAVPLLGSRPQPVCAAYRRSALPAMDRALERGNLRLTDLLDELTVHWVTGIAPALLLNLNRPRDLELLVAQGIIADSGPPR